jgi:hypothetical protein
MSFRTSARKASMPPSTLMVSGTRPYRPSPPGSLRTARRHLKRPHAPGKQLVGAKSIEQVIEIQSQYAKRTYDNFVAEASRLGEWYVSVVQNAARQFEKPVEQLVKKKVA